MSTYNPIATPTLPTANLSSPAGVSSDIWGKVYQNYISTNLSSEQLAKGAYDAYNLLTTEKLKDFSEKTVTALETINQNISSIDGAIQTNFDVFFETTNAWHYLFTNTQTAVPLSPTARAKNYLTIPTSDDYSSADTYDLTRSITVPFASSREPGDYVPGLLKGIDFAKFRSVADMFELTSVVNESWKADTANSLASHATPMDVLVFKINQLQSQVNALVEIINGLFSGNANYVLGPINVQHINFVSTDASSINLASSTDTRFIDPNITKLSY